MFRKILVAGISISFIVSFANAADVARPHSALTASDIVKKNVDARGGQQAWRAVQTMVWTGKLGAGGNQRTPTAVAPAGKKLSAVPTDPRPKDEVLLPFRMEMQRPGKVRFEIQFYGKTAVQVFDGANGWKLRPYLNRLEVEPFTATELKAASMQSELDGPLVDYAAKGTRIELEGVEKVENRDTFKLKLTMKDGHAIHVWVDAQTFLEAKVEGQPRHLDGNDHPVEIYYRDYRQVGSLQIPFLLETRVLPVATSGLGFREGPVPAETIAIDKVLVNPGLNASEFTRPQVETASNHAPSARAVQPVPAGGAK